MDSFHNATIRCIDNGAECAIIQKTKEVSNTKNINVNVQRPPTNIPLGRQGENLATCVIFDCSGFAQLYGDGTAELLHELKDGTVYPVDITQDGASVSWIVTASDTATVGAGRAELRWYVGDTLAKSAKFRTSVSSALADSTTETPPEPYQSWVDKVLKAAQEIKDGAISDEKLAAAIAAYLEEHPIDAGLDEAALAAYLTENGYLTDAALADAVAQALAEAKASGQFDGAPGEAGADGSPGADGADGVGIQSVVQTTTSAEDGGTNIVTVTKTDGSTSTFEVRNGSKGNDGAPGADGKDGADGQPGTDGKSAYQYAVDGGYTGTEDEFKAKLAEEMPDTLPNPNALTFTGAATGSYDGSEPLTVNIPSSEGGSGGIGGLSQLATVTLTEPAASIVLNFTEVDDIIISAQFTGGLDESTNTTIKLIENYKGSGAGFTHNATVKLSSSAVGYYMGYLYGRSLKIRGVLYAQTNIKIVGNTTALRYENAEDNVFSIRVFTDSATPFGKGTTITVYGGKL